MMTRPEFLNRVVADSLDRPAWLAARVGKIGASNAAGYALIESAPVYLRSLLKKGWQGNAYADHGHSREPHILRAFGVDQNTLMFASATNPLHVATPDGYKVSPTGDVVLVQVKTTSKPITKLSPGYYRQCLWEQYVCDTDRTLFAWEEHRDFRPVRLDPESMIVYRNESEIRKLITIANIVLDGYALFQEFTRNNTMEATSE
jgi:hypothetical protein